MCELLTTSTEKKIEGFKIVARKPKGKRYFSIAMGFKYPLDGHIPIVRNQHRISLIFMDHITSKHSPAHRHHMLGRTSVYLNICDAWRRYHVLIQSSVRRGYKLVVVRAEVSGNIMEGYYTGRNVMDRKVAAGRNIRFIEEYRKIPNPYFNKV